jgi:NDP-sugar pyrophosphorylase family protein
MRLEEIHCVILAGGLGSRLRSVLSDVPKPLAPVQGKPFLEWVGRWLVASGVTSATISTGYRSDKIEQYFAAQPVAGLQVDCAREDQPLGTGGGFLNAARMSGRMPGAWLVLNGDSLMLTDVRAVVAALEHSGAEGAIVARRVADSDRYGRLELGPDGRLLRFAEKAAGDPGPGLINAGVYLFRPALLDCFPEQLPLSFEVDVFPAWLRTGVPIAVLESEAPFLDIGTEASLALADGFIRDNQGRFQ